MIIGLGREMYKKITVITLLTGVCENKTVYQRQLFILLKKIPPGFFVCTFLHTDDKYFEQRFSCMLSFCHYSVICERVQFSIFY